MSAVEAAEVAMAIAANMVALFMYNQRRMWELTVATDSFYDIEGSRDTFAWARCNTNVSKDGKLVADKGLSAEVAVGLATDLARGVDVGGGHLVSSEVMLYVRDRVYRVVSVQPTQIDPRPPRDFGTELKGYGEDVVSDTEYSGEYGGEAEANGTWDLLALVLRGAVTVNKIVVCVREADAEFLRKYLATRASQSATVPFTITQALGFAIELIPPTASKGTALEIVLEKLGIKWDEVLCFGDAENDVSMLQLAELSVAMGNATTSAQNAAKFRTIDNSQGGVGWVMSKVFGDAAYH
ncbi:hypothetical protein HDU93_006851 [Gonapodya sp. JEL0774]|nr:hypothetical protein HDU93_006851 [Gonapodya sp. JEL0774]